MDRVRIFVGHRNVLFCTAHFRSIKIIDHWYRFPIFIHLYIDRSSNYTHSRNNNIELDVVSCWLTLSIITMMKEMMCQYTHLNGKSLGINRIGWHLKTASPQNGLWRIIEKSLIGIFWHSTVSHKTLKKDTHFDLSNRSEKRRKCWIDYNCGKVKGFIWLIKSENEIDCL